MAIEDDLLAADKQLYPTGRAFYLPIGSDIEKLHLALNVSQKQSYEDIKSLFTGLLPDNPDFSADDCANWERVYGISNNSGLPLDQRIAALLQRISFPGGNKARQHLLFIEGEVQKAGFDVYFYENIFDDGMGGWMTRTPEDVSGETSILYQLQYGDRQYGDNQYGSFYNIILANHINEEDDYDFDFDGDLSATFFVGGPTLGSFADVPAERHDEFRQLILNLKPASTVGFLFINYT